VSVTKTQRRRYLIGLQIVLLLGTIVGVVPRSIAATGSPPVAEAGWPPLTTNGGFMPTALPADHKVPVAVHLSVEQTSGNWVGIAEQKIVLDRSFGLDGVGFPTCRRPRGSCRPQVIGRGAAVVGEIETTEHTSEPIRVFFLDGGSQNATLLIRGENGRNIGKIFLSELSSGGVTWRFVTASRSNGGELFELAITLPRRRSDAGPSATLTARCSRGRLTAEVMPYRLNDGSKIEGGRLVRPCRQHA